MSKLNVAEVASQVLSRKIDRVDMQMLVALEASPDHTLRLEDRAVDERLPPLPNAPKGAPPRLQRKLVQGLHSLVDSFCDDRPDMTVIPQPPIIERHAKTGETIEYPRDPIIMRFSLARLERMCSGSAECPALIEHTGGADEETAKKPTRLLRLSDTGEIMLQLWRDGRTSVPFPDPSEPTAEKPKQDPKAEKPKQGQQAAA